MIATESTTPLRRRNTKSSTMASTSSSSAGVRNVVTGFFSSVVLSSERDHPEKPYLPEPSIPYERLQEKHAEAIQRLGLSRTQLQRVLDEQWPSIQTKLRDTYNTHTNGVALYHVWDLLRDHHTILLQHDAETQQATHALEAAQRQEQRKFRIQQELAEARIKARQALQLDEVWKEKEQPVTPQPKGGTAVHCSKSPDSVAAFVSDHANMPRYDVDMSISSSDDGDIQEIIEEGDEEAEDDDDNVTPPAGVVLAAS